MSYANPAWDIAREEQGEFAVVSLKAFHVFFVTAALLMAIGFGVWSMRDYQAGGQSSALYLAWGAFAVAGLLGVYGVWFLKKLKRVSA